VKLGPIFLALAIVVVGVVAAAGLRGHHFSQPPFELFPDMNYQDKVKDQQPSAFFADGMASREPVPGTVALEMPAVNDYWATGKWDDSHWGDGIPVHDARDGGRPLAIDEENMARGRERYNISCAVCHGAAGDGQGVVTKYGLTGVASYHNDRLRQAADGDIFNTISNGKGQMLGYAYNITIDDRWRIVMYVRALQRSQNAPLSDASPDEQAELDKTKKPPPPPAPAPAAPAAAPAPAPAAAAKPPGTTSNVHPANSDEVIMIKGADGKEYASVEAGDGTVVAIIYSGKTQEVYNAIAPPESGSAKLNFILRSGVDLPEQSTSSHP
jgi:mono/diheme cytochrome c family protein